MTQTASPLIDAEWTDEQFRAHFSDLDSVLGDPAGAAYQITLPGSGNDVLIGTGAARVAGFLHQVTATEPVTVPAASGTARTDSIVIRYNSAWPVDGNARPCRLYRVAGTPGAGPPTLDVTPPGVEEMPLWNITRAPSQALSLATTQDRRRWLLPRVASQSTAPPVTPVYGTEWTQTDTGRVYQWSGSAWKFIRSVRAHRQARPFTVHFVDSVATGTVVFPEPFAAVPDSFNVWAAAITDNTPVNISPRSITQTQFRYVAWSASGAGTGYTGDVSGGWTAEIL